MTIYLFALIYIYFIVTFEIIYPEIACPGGS